MVLTAAERSKRYREKIKQDPVKNELHKKKELKRLKKHFKKIKELTEEEKDARRKRWREQKRNQKEKKKSLGQVIQSLRIRPNKIYGCEVRRRHHLVRKNGGGYDAEEYEEHPERYISTFAQTGCALF